MSLREAMERDRVTVTESDPAPVKTTTALAWDAVIGGRKARRASDDSAVLLDALEAIDPAALDYAGWLSVGQALHFEGQPVEVWEDWSRRDPDKFKPGECKEKWEGFGRNDGPPVTGGTICHIAEGFGWVHPAHRGKAEPAPKAEGGESARMLPPWVPVRASYPPRRSPALIHGLLRRGHVTMLAGKGKAGKSWAAVRLACAVATGGEWFGWKCEAGRVLYLDPEIDPDSLDNRFAEVCNAARIDTAEVDCRVCRWSLRGVEGASIGAVLHDLREFGGSERLDLVIIDSCSTFVEGDENSSVDVRSFSAHLLKIAKATGAAVFIVHHFGKGPAGDRDVSDRGRGSSVWLDFPDATLFLTELFPPGGEVPEGFPEGGRAFLLESGGMREFPSPEPVRVVFSWPLHYIDREGMTASWKVQSAQSRGGQKTAEKNKAKSADRGDRCMLALASEFMRRGDECEAMKPGEAAEVCTEALGEPVNVSTLKKYVEASKVFEVEQTAKNRWQIVRAEAAEG